VLRVLEKLWTPHLIVTEMSKISTRWKVWMMSHAQKAVFQSVMLSLNFERLNQYTNIRIDKFPAMAMLRARLLPAEAPL
jgi:hypothetical protein